MTLNTTSKEPGAQKQLAETYWESKDIYICHMQGWSKPSQRHR